MSLDGDKARSTSRRPTIRWSRFGSGPTLEQRRVRLGGVERVRRLEGIGEVTGVQAGTSNWSGSRRYAHLREPERCTEGVRRPRCDVVADVDAAEAAFNAASDRFRNGALGLKGFDVTERAVVEADPERSRALTVGQPGCADEARNVEITRYESDEVTLRGRDACTGLLVLSDTYFPGWQATVNGEPAEIHPTDMAFRGVVVEAGRLRSRLSLPPATSGSGVLVASPQWGRCWRLGSFLC